MSGTSDLRDAIGQELERSRIAEQLAASKAQAQQHGLAWALGAATLYKFKSFSGESRCHVLDILENDRLYLSSADQLNDPFELAPVFRHSGNPDDPAYVARLEEQELRVLRGKGLSESQIEELRQSEGSDIHTLPKATTEQFRQQLRAMTRIVSLSAVDNHPLLWSHYAGGHSGVCLHFRCDSFSTLNLARQVVYPNARQPILLPLEDQTHDEIVQRMVLEKESCWSYEQEFRWILDTENPEPSVVDGSYLKIQRSDLVGVTFGMLMPEADCHVICDVLAKRWPGVPVFKAHPNYDEFQIEVRPFLRS